MSLYCIKFLEVVKSLEGPLIAGVHLVKDVENYFKVSRIVEKVNLGATLVLQVTVIKPLTCPKVLVGVLFLIDSEDLGVGRGELGHCGFLVRQSIATSRHLSSLNVSDELGEIHLVADPETHISTVAKRSLPAPEGGPHLGAILRLEAAAPSMFNLAIVTGIVMLGELDEGLVKRDFRFSHLVAGVEGRVGLEGHW
jgi:hypothetical protein